MNDETTAAPQTTTLMSRLGPMEISDRGLIPKSFEDAFRFAKAIHQSQMCPTGFSETDVCIVILHGMELGISPIAAVQSSYVVNRRVAIYGDLPLALVRRSGLLESYSQKFDGKEYEDDFTCIVTTKRKGEPEPMVSTYSVRDAKLAEVWGKKGPWSSSPKRMLMFRARGFNLRDNFADVLKGTAIAELEDTDYTQGIEGAKQARVVEPNFDGPKAVRHLAASAPPEAPPVEKPAAPPVPPPKPPKAPPASDQGELLPKRGPGRPKKPLSDDLLPTPTPPAQPPAQEETHLLSAAGSEIAKRLAAANLGVKHFIFLMQEHELCDPEATDLSGVKEEGFELALKQWDDVLNMLRNDE